MITIIPPKDFKTVPWKNGKGSTLELAINEGGTMADFNWRISIATVANDGLFSNFKGMIRNLVLIEGNGIGLEHETPRGDKFVDPLNTVLDVAQFDGGFKTNGTLTNGPIKDLNIMVRASNFDLVTKTFRGKASVDLGSSDLCLIYSLSGDMALEIQNTTNIDVPAGHLLKIEDPEKGFKVTGQMMIIAHLSKT